MAATALCLVGCKTTVQDLDTANCSVNLQDTKYRLVTESAKKGNTVSGKAESSFVFWFIPWKSPSRFATDIAGGDPFVSGDSALEAAALFEAYDQSGSDILLSPMFKKTRKRSFLWFSGSDTVEVEAVPAKVKSADEIPMKDWDFIENRNGRSFVGDDPVVPGLEAAGVATEMAVDAPKAKLTIRGGAVSKMYMLDTKLDCPLSSQFDCSLKYSFLQQKYKVRRTYTYYEHYYTRRYHYSWHWGSYYTYRYHSVRRTGHYWEEETDNTNLIEPSFSWHPLRGSMFSPYVGMGYRIPTGDGDYDSELAMKAGLLMTFGVLSLNTECDIGSDIKQYAGTVGCKLGDSLELLAYCNRVDSGSAKTLVGGGVAFDF